MADDLLDVLEVQLAPPHKVRVIDTEKTERNAEAIVKMAVMRRGVECSFFTTAPARKFRDGDSYPQRDSGTPHAFIEAKRERDEGWPHEFDTTRPTVTNVSEAEVGAAIKGYAQEMGRIRPGQGSTTHRECIRAVLIAAAQVRDRAQWQPLDTAPAGSDILLCWPSGVRRVGYFNGKGWLCDGVSFDEEPTRWMPLPAPSRDTEELTQRCDIGRSV